MEYRQEDVYTAFCGSFRSEALSKRLNVEIVRAMHIDRRSTLFREIAGRPEGTGAWFSWASSEALDVSLIRQMAETENTARVFALAGVDFFGLPEKQIHRKEEERCSIFIRDGKTNLSADPQIIKIDELSLPLLDGLFERSDVTPHQRGVYRAAYETIICAADTAEFKSAVYGFVSDGSLLSAIQVSTTFYEEIDFRQNKLVNPFTRPDQRGKGYGKALMEHVLGLFPNETVVYEYDGENVPALKLAAGCGFLPKLNIDLYELEL